MRLQSPMIAMKLTAQLQPAQTEDTDKFVDRYLPSGVPSSVNLLESLESDPRTQGLKPRLSASRLSRIDTLAEKPSAISCPIRVNELRAFRASPAISCRVRYVKANARTGKPSSIASLDIETAPFSAEIVRLMAIEIELPEGSTQDLNMTSMPMLPLDCRPGDTTVFLFRLTPDETVQDRPSPTSARTVLIAVHAIVLFSPSCQPEIKMRWKTGVDFSTALNPVYGAPAQSMQRQRRPENLSRTNSNTSLSSIAALTQEADSIAHGTQTRQGAVSISDFGISLTVTAPTSVIVGQVFSWKVLVLNPSSKPRRFTITIVTKRNKGLKRNHVSKGSTPSLAPRFKPGNLETDESLLDVLRKGGGVGAKQIVSLSTEIETGWVVSIFPRSASMLTLIKVPSIQHHALIQR